MAKKIDDLPPGTVVQGKYELISKLGAGGMGAVYKARHLRLGKTVAIKFLLPQHRAEQHLVKRFLHEARLTASLDDYEDREGQRGHKSIARMYDVDLLEDGSPYYVMELLEGLSLRQILTESGALDVSKALKVAVDMFDALAWAHSKGVIHRDIKPDNVFIETRGPLTTIKLVDFGIARVAGVSMGTGRGLMGTIRYMPREALLGDAPSPKQDVYAATTTLFLMLAGRTPFAHIRDENELGAALTADEPLRAPLLSRFGNFPMYLVSLVARGLSFDPEERPDAFFMARELFVVKRELDDVRPASNATIEELSTAIHTIARDKLGTDGRTPTEELRDREALAYAATSLTPNGAPKEATVATAVAVSPPGGPAAAPPAPGREPTAVTAAGPKFTDPTKEVPLPPGPIIIRPVARPVTNDTEPTGAPFFASSTDVDGGVGRFNVTAPVVPAAPPSWERPAARPVVDHEGPTNVPPPNTQPSPNGRGENAPLPAVVIAPSVSHERARGELTPPPVGATSPETRAAVSAMTPPRRYDPALDQTSYGDPPLERTPSAARRSRSQAAWRRELRRIAPWFLGFVPVVLIGGAYIALAEHEDLPPAAPRAAAQQQPSAASAGTTLPPVIAAPAASPSPSIEPNVAPVIRATPSSPRPAHSSRPPKSAPSGAAGSRALPSSGL